MSEFGNGDSRPMSSEFLSVQYQNEGARKVANRFELNEFAESPCDFEIKTAELLEILGLRSGTIVDLGTSDGHFLQLLRLYGQGGRLIGVEPNTNQYNYASIWQPLDIEPVHEAIQRDHGHAEAKDFYEKLASKVTRAIPGDIELMEGHANYIPLPDDTAKVLSAMFSLYHVPDEKQVQAFSEIKRVLAPEGMFVLTTSGNDNKQKHRKFEREIALDLGLSEPALMNSGFDTEKAEVELTKYFNHVYRFIHHDNMLINNTYRLRAYLRSQRSLRDQYTPIPDEETFDDALNRIVVPQIIRAIRTSPDRSFKDIISRSLYVCGDVPLRLPQEFEPISLLNTKRRNFR